MSISLLVKVPLNLKFETGIFSLRLRKDLRELFGHFATVSRTVSDSSIFDSQKISPDHFIFNEQDCGKCFLVHAHKILLIVMRFHLSF